jgi:hypothetical protein
VNTAGCLCWKNVSKYWHNNLLELGPFLSGFLDKFAFFPRFFCQTNVFNPVLRKGKKSKHYLGIEPSTLGVADVNANHYTIQAAIINLFLGCSSKIRALSTKCSVKSRNKSFRLCQKVYFAKNISWIYMYKTLCERIGIICAYWNSSNNFILKISKFWNFLMSLEIWYFKKIALNLSLNKG